MSAVETEVQSALDQELERRNLDANLSPLEAEMQRRGLNPQQDVTTTPLEAPKPRTQIRSGGKLDPFVQTTRVPSTIVKAAENGIEFDKPAPEGHFLASFAIDDEHREKAYRMALTQRYGEQADVRVGPSGSLEYFNPKTNRYALIDPPGMNVANIEGLAGPAITVGMETAGGLLGSLSRHPSVVAAGIGGGAFFGELTRLYIGERMGVNDDVDDAAMITKALTVGGISAGAGVVGSKLFDVGKAFLNALRGKMLPKQAAEALNVDISTAREIVESVNSRVDSAGLRLSLAQATNSEDMLVIQDMLKRSPEYSAMFREFSQEQEAALRLYWDTINKPYRSRLTTTQTGERVQAVAEGRVSRETMRADEFVRVKRAELDTLLEGVDSRPFESLGRPIRDVGDAEQAAFKRWADDAARALNDTAGNSAFIPNRATVEAVTALDKKARDALIPMLSKQARQLIGKADGAGAEIAEVPTRKIFDPNAKFTFAEAWSAVSALKRIERVASKGLTTTDPDTGMVRQLRQAIEADMKAAFDGSPMRSLYEGFVRKYAIQKRRLDQGAVANVMERVGGQHGRYRIADEKVFESFFANKRDAEEIFDLIKTDVALLDETRRGILDFWQRQVIRDGRVNLSAHKQWLQRYGEQASVFMNKHEMKMLMNPANAERALQAREQARKAALDSLNKTFEAELVNLNNPTRIAQMVLDRNNPGRSSQIAEMLKDVPDVLRAVRSETRKQIAERVAGQYRNGERFFSPARLDEFLNGKGGEKGFRQNIENVFGRDYVNDLDTLNEALKLVSRETQFPNRSNTAFWTDTLKNISRAYVGMFTRPGRVITAVARLRGQAANRVMARAMLNPAALKTLVELGDLRDEKAAAFISAMGGAALLQDFEPGAE